MCTTNTWELHLETIQLLKLFYWTHRFPILYSQSVSIKISKNIYKLLKVPWCCKHKEVDTFIYFVHRKQYRHCYPRLGYSPCHTASVTLVDDLFFRLQPFCIQFHYSWFSVYRQIVGSQRVSWQQRSWGASQWNTIGIGDNSPFSIWNREGGNVKISW